MPMSKSGEGPACRKHTRNRRRGIALPNTIEQRRVRLHRSRCVTQSILRGGDPYCCLTPHAAAAPLLLMLLKTCEAAFRSMLFMHAE